MRAGDRIEVVGRDLREPEARIEFARSLHVVQRVEQHHRETGLRTPVHQRLRQHAPQAEPPEPRAHEEALHLAGVGVVDVVQGTQRAAAGHLATNQRQQQRALGQRVLARQRRELGVEILEAQVDVEAGRVLAEDRPRRIEQRRRGRRQQFDGRGLAAFPHRAPMTLRVVPPRVSARLRSGRATLIWQPPGRWPCGIRPSGGRAGSWHQFPSRPTDHAASTVASAIATASRRVPAPSRDAGVPAGSILSPRSMGWIRSVFFLRR